MISQLHLLNPATRGNTLRKECHLILGLRNMDKNKSYLDIYGQYLDIDIVRGKIRLIVF